METTKDILYLFVGIFISIFVGGIIGGTNNNERTRFIMRVPRRLYKVIRPSLVRTCSLDNRITIFGFVYQCIFLWSYFIVGPIYLIGLFIDKELSRVLLEKWITLSLVSTTVFLIIMAIAYIIDDIHRSIKRR